MPSGGPCTCCCRRRRPASEAEGRVHKIPPRLICAVGLEREKKLSEALSG